MATDLIRPPASEARYSVPSIIAIIAAVASWFVGPGFSIVLAIVAIIAGLIGAVVALGPARRGGMMSVLAVLGRPWRWSSVFLT